MARPVPVLVVLIALMAVLAVGLTLPAVPVLAKGGPPLQETSAVDEGNDAGSGQDAGDSIQSALGIANAQRTWSGNLTPAGSDADWYQLAGDAAFCAVGSVTTQSPGAITVSADTARALAVSREGQPHTATRLALAAPAGHVPILGVEPPSMSAMMPADENGGPPSPGRYTFAFSARTYVQLDPEGDGEAPEAGSTPATSAPLPTDCAAGKLSSSAGDTQDAYHFDVASVRAMTFSFAVASGDDAQVRIVTPSGATYATLRSGAAIDVWADEPGRWSVVVEPPATTTLAAFPAPALGAPTMTSGALSVQETLYMLGVTEGPDPEPCRPMC